MTSRVFLPHLSDIGFPDTCWRSNPYWLIVARYSRWYGEAKAVSCAYSH